MKLKQLTFRKIRRLQAFMPVLVVGVLTVTGAVINNFNARAATAGAGGEQQRQQQQGQARQAGRRHRGGPSDVVRGRHACAKDRAGERR